MSLNSQLKMVKMVNFIMCILLQLQKKCLLYILVPPFLKLTCLWGHSGCWAPLAPVTAALEAGGGEVQPARDRTEPSNTAQP